MNAHGKHKTLRSRKWFGTIWDNDDLEMVRNLQNDQKCTYLIISALDHTKNDENEVNGVKCDHYHVFYQLLNPRAHLPTKSAHWEISRSISGSNNYCEEKGTPLLLHGVIHLDNNNKEDWLAFVNACKSSTPKEMIDGPFSKLYAQYRMFAGEIRNQYRMTSIIQGELINERYFGIFGSGKTSKAAAENPDAYWKNTNKWWDGYNNEDVVIIDDWSPNHECFTWHLKIWSDRYPFNAETKGSSMFIRPKKIIITSNYSIEECFHNEQDIATIKRRFKVTKFMTLKKFDYNGIS